MQTRPIILTLCLVVILLVAACATRQPLVTIEPSKGETVLPVRASSFKFEPNNIKAYKGNLIALRIDNISGTIHNFTIKDPQGHILKSVPLPAKETTVVRVDLSEPGVYEFYCDKPFHAAFGMKGRIDVQPAAAKD
jgi:uncharacterized cupredoxin-like copper-binding protein